MDLHRAAFKMENSPYLPNPLASPALMVLASTAEASRDASIPCQQPRPFGVPVSADKDVHIPFTNGSYTFASMYHRQGGVPGAFANRDFPPSLLHLHPQFAPPNLDCTPISMLNHSGVGAFRPFASTEDRESYQSAFTPAKRLKNCHDTDSPHLRFSDADGKEYEFGTQLPSSSPGSLKVDDTGKKIFAVSGLISDRETSSSPEDRSDRCKKKATLFDSQAPICPICQVLLRPGELQEHMEQELEKLTQLNISKNSILKDAMAAGTPKSILLSASIKREGDSPTASPHSSDDIHHSDRYQTFLRVRANRQTRLNARIGKMKRRKQDEGQREGSCMTEDDSVDIENENGNRFEEYEWCGQKRIRATTLLEGGFRGSGFIMCSGKENPDSDADLDVDGDDTLEYGKPQYTEADVIPCTGEEPGEAKEREALRGAVLNGGTPSTRITPEFSKWASDEMPSTSNGESSKQETMQKTCKNSDIEKITEDSAVTTFEALKARVRELERQLSRGDRYKCLICMDSYTMPLTSIQCWHVHCEECWLRTLGAKKLCPQCNTITSPGDLRRIYL
ncbi:E3 ubiquitin-protein ligase RNF220 isoform X4 [Struthio camelus]|uniref:E3 ubiquitin-protein ligase RNF220 n=3 Tax=Aves TaxID=8782 RepID=A0A6J3DAK3_AYTFU|nr:E3 ubiquitin-protein ligase RNF220 isoform X3 [Apteryx rowi]XP_032048461.1 E3 ubiquitin-protein ligase RNF220 isoform X2 [Aythya fuligula]XP_035189075.1 E3 ubiquitin-protein ligase RNF220 isoform X4 [Oxyura jamaicensis]XP_035393733.1 E3 ubiquitin-protein ligase RNF220 isoform X3 [Cygnus atratus]XP_040421886.1 E3 ubiquitin-protein ligase RNF220 isoform X6 [Cygnus olor]XP_047915227.1 E3 ubiquitin-protein ligase RNF220 isoform X4 [Anser cygnoides]NXC39612.1 RN220 ligase [Penelope pileata]|eukprot:XP_027319440.1 E3 ubiquitin-protein ligase RNF220 isoform X4 [Anas platyrhynchos]